MSQPETFPIDPDEMRNGFQILQAHFPTSTFLFAGIILAFYIVDGKVTNTLMNLCNNFNNFNFNLCNQMGCISFLVDVTRKSHTCETDGQLL